MGRIVYQDLDLSVTADATQDVWSIMANSSEPVTLHGFELTSADTTAEIIELHLHRISAVGSGGSASTTEELADEKFGAVTASLRTLDTTPGTDAGLLLRWQWEQLGPVGIIFTPEMRPVSKISEGFALTWDTATAATVGGWVCWEEG